MSRLHLCVSSSSSSSSLFVHLGQRKLFYPAISADGPCEVRINFGTQPFACSDFNYLNHGLGRSLADPDIDDEALKAQELALLAEETAARARMASMVDEDAIERAQDAVDAAQMAKVVPSRVSFLSGECHAPTFEILTPPLSSACRAHTSCCPPSPN